MAGLIAVWALFGLRISRAVAPLLVLLVTFNIGGMIVDDADGGPDATTPLYLAVSLFLAFTAVFFAAVTEAQPALYRLIFMAWLAAGGAHLDARHRRLFPRLSGRGDVHQLRPRRRRLPGPERVRPVPGAARHLPALPAADRQHRQDAALRRAAADHRRRHLLLVLARRLGPVRGLGDPADRRRCSCRAPAACSGCASSS